MGTRMGDINTLFSQMGTCQGDPLGGALFALGHLCALRSTTVDHLLCIFPSYVDDTYIAGPVDAVLLTFHTLQDQLSSVGLTIQPAKCTAWCPQGLPPSFSLPQGFGVSTSGQRILGATLGPDPFVHTFAVEALQEALESLHDLPLLGPTGSFWSSSPLFCTPIGVFVTYDITIPSLLAAYGDFDTALLDPRDTIRDRFLFYCRGSLRVKSGDFTCIIRWIGFTVDHSSSYTCLFELLGLGRFYTLDPFPTKRPALSHVGRCSGGDKPSRFPDHSSYSMGFSSDRGSATCSSFCVLHPASSSTFAVRLDGPFLPICFFTIIVGSIFGCY
ncbi:hypothetical protein R1flu_025125 [Riccia fluitans]|uniref:Reverse transcriptase domain-containing protein n=1 Tax=Riccia fluitans TaxID=41844 RepID=A0ABD1XWU6_9MARC